MVVMVVIHDNIDKNRRLFAIDTDRTHNYDSQYTGSGQMSSILLVSTFQPITEKDAETLKN